MPSNSDSVGLCPFNLYGHAAENRRRQLGILDRLKRVYYGLK